MSENERITVTDHVAAVTANAVLLSKLSSPFGGQQEWIAKSLILDSDTDLDEIEKGDEITIEIPLWLAQEKGLEE